MALGYRRRRAEGETFVLEELCVAREARRGGIGGRLLGHLCDALAREGVGPILLLTRASGPEETFYLKRGFQGDPQTVVMTRN